MRAMWECKSSVSSYGQSAPPHHQTISVVASNLSVVYKIALSDRNFGAHMKLSATMVYITPSVEMATAMKQEGVQYAECGWNLLLGESKQVELAKTIYAEHGVVFKTCHAPFSGEAMNLSSLDNSMREKAVASHIHVIKNTQLIGARVLVLHPGSRSSKENFPAHREQLLKSLTELEVSANEANIKLAVENMPPGYFGSSGAELLDIVSNFSSEHIGLCFDVGHANMAFENTNTIQEFDAMQERIIALHLHDNDNCQDSHLQPGYGSADWVKLAPRFNALTLEVPACIEAYPYTASSWRQMEKETNALLAGRTHTVVIDGKEAQSRCTQCDHIIFKSRDSNSNENTFCACTDSSDGAYRGLLM